MTTRSSNIISIAMCAGMFSCAGAAHAGVTTLAQTKVGEGAAFGRLGLWLTQFTDGPLATVAASGATVLSVIASIWMMACIANNIQVVRSKSRGPKPDSVRRTVVMMFALVIAFGASRDMGLMFGAVNDLQDGMATVFLRRGSPWHPATVFDALDFVNNQASSILETLSHLDLEAASAMVSIGTVIFLVVGGCFVLLAKVLLTFVIAIGPIAVLCLMSKPTTNFFRAWLPIALNAVALSLVVFLVLGLSFFGLEQLLQAMQSSVAVGAAHPAHVIEAAATYLTFVVVLCIGLYHVVPLTSQVGRVVAAYLARPIASGASNADAATSQGMVARVAELGAQGK